MMRKTEEHQFLTHDGVSLFYRRWPATTAIRRGVIVMFHRGHEHGARMGHLAHELNMPEFDFYAWDARGHGESPGMRGHSPSLLHSVRDVQTFIQHICNVWCVAEKDVAVLAQSVGAVLVSTWVHDYAPQIRCMVLASPAFKVKLYVPFARLGLAFLQKLKGHFFVNSYVKSKHLTHDKTRQKSYDNDPLISKPISVNILLSLYAAAERVVADAHAIVVPTQLLISGADWVVHHGPQHKFFDRLGSVVKEKHVFSDFYHDTLGEKKRKLATDRVRDFIVRQFAASWTRPDLRKADCQGETYNEALRFAQPISALSLRGLYWLVYRVNLRFAGLLSDGVSLGQRTGFDSGSTLDYVYRNTPSGWGVLGRSVDRRYLDAVGWKGIRQRKLHVEEMLRIALIRLQAEGKSLRVLDIAAGHGRYVLDTVDSCPRPESIVLRDFSELNVHQGSKLIAEKGLSDVAKFMLGDAFDSQSLTSINPRSTIGIVSGLYELFPNNDAVSTSLNGMFGAIEPGGLLIYTGQPWHPQLELIARVLTSHRDRQAWVMRRRSQAEIDQLVIEAGFEKLDQRIDQWGIFTVSLARRKSHVQTH